MVTLHPGKKSVLTITNIIDGSGNPTTPQAKPTYTADVTGFVTLKPAEDGLSCDVVWADSGSTPTIVTASVDGITKTATFHTIGGAVADFSLLEGAEVDA